MKELIHILDDFGFVHNTPTVLRKEYTARQKLPGGEIATARLEIIFDFRQTSAKNKVISFSMFEWQGADFGMYLKPEDADKILRTKNKELEMFVKNAMAQDYKFVAE